MDTVAADSVILDGEFEPDRRHLNILGGELVAYTARSPDKDTENEDTVAVIPWGPQAGVLIVADGAGGLPGGKRASHTAVTTLLSVLQSAAQKTALLRTAVLNGIDAANQAVREIGNGCATTLTIVTVEGRLVRSYQIGDSEALVVGQRGLIKLQTTAHSPTGFAVEAGFMNEREALQHEERHLVSNFIGTVDMSIDIGASIRLAARDTIAVVSDGITDNLLMREIIACIRKGPLAAAADRLVAAASARMRDGGGGLTGKPDDLSAIVFRKLPPKLKNKSQTR